MEFQPQLVLIYFIPVFSLFIGLEMYLLRRPEADYPDSARYSWKDTISNGFLALFHEIGDGLAAIAVIAVYYSVFDFRLFNIRNATPRADATANGLSPTGVCCCVRHSCSFVTDI